MEDDIIQLSYKSVCLRKSDISCFNNYNYLNDLSISFYYEVLSEKFSKFETEFLLLDPSCVCTIFFDDEISDLKDCFGALGFESRKFIFIPVNDTTDKYAYGSGNHWALVVYYSQAKTFYYLDSMKSYIKNTIEICRKINMLIGNNENQPVIEVVDTPKLQLNTFDCGVFVLNFTEIILDFFYGNGNEKEIKKDSNREKTFGFKFEKIITQENSGQDTIAKKRVEVRNLVYSMIKK